MNTITRDELKTAFDNGAPLTILEALPEKYFRHSHLPGARLFPHDQARELAPALLPDKARVSFCIAPARLA